MRKMGDILLDRGLITSQDLNKALEIQSHSDKFLGQILLEMQLITEDVLTDIQASRLGLSVISTAKLNIHPRVVQFIPESIAVKYRLVPIYVEAYNGKNVLCMVTSEEPPGAVINKMSEKLNIPIKLFLASYSELEELLVEHYKKERLDLSQPKVEASAPNIHLSEDVLTGDLLEDDEEEEEVLDGDLLEEEESLEEAPEEILEESPKKEASSLKLELSDDIFKEEEENPALLPDLDLGLPKEEAKTQPMPPVPEPTPSLPPIPVKKDEDADITPKKVPEAIKLDFFDDIEPEPSIKLESENNIPTLNINRGKPQKEEPEVTSEKEDVHTAKEEDAFSLDLPNFEDKKEKEEKKDTKKLNFLEAFKDEDSIDFEEKEDYVNVSFDEEHDEVEDIQELDVDDVDLFDDVEIKAEESYTSKPNKKAQEKTENKNLDDDDFPFALDDLGIPSPKNNKKDKTPPPLGGNGGKPLSIPTPKPKPEPKGVDKSAFPKPEIKKFTEYNEDETNPSISNKVSDKEKEETDKWLKKNKNRAIPDLDSIFGDEEAEDPLNNKKIDKLILDKKLKHLSTELVKVLKDRKVNRLTVDKFNKFFKELPNNPSNLLLVSMLELVISGENQNIDLFFDLLIKNIENVHSKDK